MDVYPKPVTAVIVGAGNRGAIHAAYAGYHPNRLRIAGVAEPRAAYRQHLVDRYGIPAENAVADWRDLVDRPRLADAVVIATPDHLHAEPAIAFAGKGYALLVEKPMAPTEAECRRIVAAVKAAGVLFAVCHVLRYTPYTRAIKQLVTAGTLGDLVSIQHLEPVGYWHQAHSYVRGNWRNEAESAFMLLTKSCHDLDWIRYIMDEPCQAVSSFGTLKHFARSEKPAPAGTATRCLDCTYEPHCPYSAIKIYRGRLARGETGWPVDVVTPEPTEASLTEALRTGPYGRCVYECDNDVVDNQVVSMLFRGRQTATLTMTGFSAYAPRKTRLFGTRGELYTDGHTIEYCDFLTDQVHTIPLPPQDSIPGAHYGGDYYLMESFVAAVATQDPRRVLSGPDESLETHRMTFAAERARRDRTVVTLEIEPQ